MKKLKVLHIIPDFEVGGAEKVVLDYLLNQEKSNLEIMAISLYKFKKTIYTKIANENGIDIKFLDKKPGLDFKVILEINKIIKKYKPDVIHTHLYSLKYTILPMIFNKTKKRFHTIHSRAEKDASGLDKVLNTFSFKFLKVKPIALNESLRKEINSYYNIKTTEILGNGLDLSQYNRSEQESKLLVRKSLGISANSFIIGHVGSFKDVKNHSFLIEIFYRIQSIKKDAHLVLVGDGPMRKSIIEKAKKLNIIEKITFLGVRSDVPRILKAFDVFVFPSKYEGFPIALIEAQLVGVNIVTSNRIDDSVLINTNIKKIDLSDDIEIWVKKIIESKSIESNTNIEILNCFSIDNALKKLELIYRG